MGLVMSSATGCDKIRIQTKGGNKINVNRLHYGVVPKGLLTFLGLLGNAEFSP